MDISFRVCTQVIKIFAFEIYDNKSNDRKWNGRAYIRWFLKKREIY